MTPFDTPGKRAFWKHWKLLKTFFHFRQIWNCRLQALSLWKSKIFRQMLISVFDREENIVGKEENAGNQHFFFFPLFSKGFFLGFVKSRDCVVKS